MAILKVRNTSNQWEAVKNLEINSLRLGEIKLTNPVEDQSNLHAAIGETGKKEVLAYKSYIDSKADEMKNDMDSFIDTVNSNIAKYHPDTIYYTEGSPVIDIIENGNYDLTNVSSVTLNLTGKRAHGFITFTSRPSVQYNGPYKVSGDEFADGGRIWEFDIYPHDGVNYIIWKNWSN